MKKAAQGAACSLIGVCPAPSIGTQETQHSTGFRVAGRLDFQDLTVNALGSPEGIFLASAATAIAGTGLTTVAPPTRPRFVRLWGEKKRTEQLARLKGLELQADPKWGQQAWQQAHVIWRQLPEGVRIDLPSPHVFSRVLGVFRSGATLKQNKLLRLEISAEEIGDLIGNSKATVEVALRWLGTEAIEYGGEVVARGLGMIHSGRRTAWAFLEGERKRVYRTSVRVLTIAGRLMLGLGLREDERKRERREKRWKEQQAAKNAKMDTVAVSPSPVRREEEHVEGMKTGSGGDSELVADIDDDDVGLGWIKSIKGKLGIE